MLCGFWLTSRLLLNLPVREEVLVTASRTLPESLHGIGSAFVRHLDDKMTMKAHRRVAVNLVTLSGLINDFIHDLIHDWHKNPLFKLGVSSRSQRAPGSLGQTDIYDYEAEIRTSRATYTDV